MDVSENVANGDLQTIGKIVAAKDVESAWSAFTDHMETRGFDRLLYGIAYDPASGGLGALDDLFMLATFPRAYVDRYVGKGLIRHAPMIRWAAVNEGSCSWRVLQEGPAAADPRSRNVVEFNRRMGIQNGYTISFGAVPPCGRAALALAARRGIGQDEVDELWARDGKAIERIASVFHMRIATLPRGRHGVRLTERQRQVLKLTGTGHSVAEIALETGLSEVTVQKHLRLARERLGVRTSAEAVLKAAILSQLFVPPTNRQ